MADLSFMQQKFSVPELVAHFMEDIKALRQPGMAPVDETKLQTYYQAAKTFERMGIMDIVRFVRSYGRDPSGQSAQMREAFSTLLGYRVTVPTQLDLAYSRLLLEYTLGFRDYRGNLKEWLLRFLLSSAFSPLVGLFDREITYVIENTQQKIQLYKSNLSR